MAQTMANKFPGTYKSNIIFKNQKPTTQRQSYDHLKDKEIPPPLTTTSVTFTTWNKNNSPNKNNNSTNNNYNEYPIGFKTFYKNNKNDKYNYPINTNYTSTNNNNNNNYYYKGDNPIIEEEDEYKTSVKQSNQKNIFQNTLKYEQYSPSREKNKYTMYNYADKKKNHTNVDQYQ